MDIICKDHPNERHRVLNYLPRFLVEMNERYEMYIAGGLISSIFTNREINDIDLYLKNKEDFLNVVTELSTNAKLTWCTDKSLVYTVSMYGKEKKINLILIETFESPKEVFELFDFTCVMGLFDLRTRMFHYHEDFIHHNSQRILKFHTGTKYPITSLFRTRKYIERGYTLSRNEELIIIFTIMGLEINNYEDLAEQIGGLYGLEVDEFMDTTKPFSLTEVIKSVRLLVKDYDSEVNIMDVDEILETYNHLVSDLLIKNLDAMFAKYNLKYLRLEENTSSILLFNGDDLFMTIRDININETEYEEEIDNSSMFKPKPKLKFFSYFDKHEKYDESHFFGLVPYAFDKNNDIVIKKGSSYTFNYRLFDINEATPTNKLPILVYSTYNLNMGTNVNKNSEGLLKVKVDITDLKNILSIEGHNFKYVFESSSLMTQTYEYESIHAFNIKDCEERDQQAHLPEKYDNYIHELSNSYRMKIGYFSYLNDTKDERESKAKKHKRIKLKVFSE